MGLSILFHKSVDCFLQILDRLLVAMFHRIHDTVFDVILKYDLAGIIDSRLNRGQLDQHLAAVSAALDHSLNGFEMTDRLGQTIDHSLGMLVAVCVIVFVVMGMTVLYHGAIFQYMLMKMFIHSSFPPCLLVVYAAPVLL